VRGRAKKTAQSRSSTPTARQPCQRRSALGGALDSWLSFRHQNDYKNAACSKVDPALPAVCATGGFRLPTAREGFPDFAGTAGTASDFQSEGFGVRIPEHDGDGRRDFGVQTV
jgi:hypothetical protein